MKYPGLQMSREENTQHKLILQLQVQNEQLKKENENLKAERKNQEKQLNQFSDGIISLDKTIKSKNAMIENAMIEDLDSMNDSQGFPIIKSIIGFLLLFLYALVISVKYWPTTTVWKKLLAAVDGNTSLLIIAAAATVVLIYVIYQSLRKWIRGY